MTHDELLEKIRNNGTLKTQLECTCPHIEVKEIPTREHRNDKALRAIVELHKPYVDHIPYCNDCERIYPCPTIQAIEKELQ